VNRDLPPPINAEHEAEQAANTVSQVFEMSGPVIQPRLHLWWRVLNQPYHMAGKRKIPIFVFRVIIPTMQLYVALTSMVRYRHRHVCLHLIQA